MEQTRKERDDALMEKDHRIVFENNGGKKRPWKIYRNDDGQITSEFFKGEYGTHIHETEDSLLKFITEMHFLIAKYYDVEVSKELEPLVNNFIYALDEIDKYLEEPQTETDDEEDIFDVVIRLYSSTFRELADR